METDKMDFGPILQNRFGEYYLPAINQEIFSLSGADSFYRRHFNKTLQNEDSIYLIVGTDSGRLVNWLITCGLAEGSRYLFIEFPSLVEQLQKSADLPQELPENLRICSPEDWLQQAEELALKDYCYLGNVLRVKSLAVVDAFFEGYLKLWTEFEERIGQYQMSVGQEIGSRIFLEKGLENLAENRTSARCLMDLFKGKTAILMAGGPSLKESYAWVRENRDHLVVLAVSRIAPQLQQENINPDFFFAIDPHDIIFHQSKGMFEFWQNTLLVNVYHLNPRLLSQWRGRSAYMGALFPWDAEMDQPKELQGENLILNDGVESDLHKRIKRNPTLAFPGITVGHQALGMAIEMGFSEIVITGLDLCFDKQGFTHTEGSEERKVGPFTSASELWVETNGGWQAETRYDFLNAIPSLEALAKLAATRKIRLVNPAPGAVKIDQIDHADWSTLQVVPLQKPAWDILQTVIVDEGSKGRMQHYEAVMQELQRVRGEVQKITRLVTEALDCNDRFFGRKGHPPDFKYKKRMDEIEKSLDEEFTDISKMVKRWGVGDFLKLSRPDKKKEWTDEEIEEAGTRYYEIYRESAGALTRLLDETRQRLRYRMDEEKPKPKLKTLMAQWQRADAPGRLQLFLQRSGKGLADYPGSIQTLMQTLLDAYQADMEATENNYSKHCFNSLATPQAIRSKVLSLFKQKDKERLRAFADGLGKTAKEPEELLEKTEEREANENPAQSIQKPNQNLKKQYQLLIDGFLAELESDADAANRAFRQITSPFLRTDAILRLMTIALRQGDLVFALPIAKRLSERSPIHIPYYGDLLRLTGKHEEALVVYGDYAKIAKNDLVTLLKLGKLHAELGHLNEARQAFEKILQEDEHNKAATLFLQQLSVIEQRETPA